MSFGVDATAQPYENENAAYFALSMLCWPILYFIAWKCTTDTNYLIEGSVIAPIHVRKELGGDGSSDTSPTTPTEPVGDEKAGAKLASEQA